MQLSSHKPPSLLSTHDMKLQEYCEARLIRKEMPEVHQLIVMTSLDTSWPTPPTDVDVTSQTNITNTMSIDLPKDEEWTSLILYLVFLGLFLISAVVVYFVIENKTKCHQGYTYIRECMCCEHCDPHEEQWAEVEGHIDKTRGDTGISRGHTDVTVRSQSGESQQSSDTVWSTVSSEERLISQNYWTPRSQRDVHLLDNSSRVLDNPLRQSQESDMETIREEPPPRPVSVLVTRPGTVCDDYRDYGLPVGGLTSPEPTFTAFTSGSRATPLDPQLRLTRFETSAEFLIRPKRPQTANPYAGLPDIDQIEDIDEP